MTKFTCRTPFLLALVLGSQACATARQIEKLNALPLPNCSASLNDVEVIERLASIGARLHANRGTAHAWWGIWVGLWGTSTVANGVAATQTHDGSKRLDYSVTAGGSALGMLPILLSPIRAFSASERFDTLGDNPNRREALCAAERLLRETAEDEANRVSLGAHLIGDVASLVVGGILVGFGHTTAGVTDAAVGIMAEELQIVTTPTSAIDDWVMYAEHGAQPSFDTAHLPTQWLIMPARNGLQLAATF